MLCFNDPSFETPPIVDDRLQKGIKAIWMLFLEPQQINKHRKNNVNKLTNS